MPFWPTSSLLILVKTKLHSKRENNFVFAGAEVECDKKLDERLTVDSLLAIFRAIIQALAILRPLHASTDDLGVVFRLEEGCEAVGTPGYILLCFDGQPISLLKGQHRLE